VRDDLGAFQNSDVQILAISVDHPFTLKAWADAQRFDFPLLADFWPHGEVAQDYGVFNAKAGFALRGTFLVDTAGTVRFAEVNGPGEARDQEAWKKALAAL
ncbi:MAG: redoxin domain-containing protein, partial [Pseudonocardia sp.]|nr:redoxin domain-containing protein [Pseudonocardia sp.]